MASAGPGRGELAVRAAASQPRPAGPEFVWVNTYRAPRGCDASPHRYPMWKLTLYTTGTIDTWVGGRRFRVAPGSLLVVPPTVDHAEVATSSYANLYLLARAPASWPWPALVEDDGGEIASYLRGVHREHWQGDGLSSAMIPALLTQLDVALRRRGGVTRCSPAHEVVQAAERLFLGHLDEPLRMDWVAAELEVSESTLRTHFHAELGVSPRERLRHLRLERALALLRSSQLTVEVIARRCGYHSASHLSRHLRQRSGLTPGEVRRGVSPSDSEGSLSSLRGDGPTVLSIP
ncbi:helix-turn-helix domain-containing protein [Aestuariimicrobium soli]|uniref:helix-turn-helix domain-containing protein n=1 Tax=Aestuariimicrobium soli TaxID=2035834 RepID=UPI003EB77852